ncbi:hypothetical protein HG536_0A06790 [Torulaspora globosa]|uniref:Inner membrane assembly complex subunit 17 n=1 Tax=Torulaspora globosa TaxID=48254 RepID=A0A7G3ZBH8_9SACH|nr:uncharacterized protein HG536_0A06790 [Torulaspora globosa]QLL30864.1 hypothetical protein HG536_0A06790 [Torulaspora globosa]
MSFSLTARRSAAGKVLYRPVARRCSRLLVSGFSTTSTVSYVNRKDIQTLEDLTKLDSLKGVEPELIKRLIDERTSELNTKNELEMLRKFDREEQLLRQSPLRRFTRPFWIFLVMSSTVYLACHYVWWRLEYEEKEIDYARRVEELETELNALLAQKDEEIGQEREDSCARPWFRRWFF